MDCFTEVNRMITTKCFDEKCIQEIFVWIFLYRSSSLVNSRRLLIN